MPKNYFKTTLKNTNAPKFFFSTLLVKFIMKCDDDSFVNVPNLIHVLLGGTLPVYKATISFYDKISVNAKSGKNRLAENKYLLMGVTSSVRRSRSPTSPASGTRRITCTAGSSTRITSAGRRTWWRSRRRSDCTKEVCPRRCSTLRTFTSPVSWRRRSNSSGNTIRCFITYQPKTIAACVGCWRNIRWHQWPSRFPTASRRTHQLSAPSRRGISWAPSWNWRSGSAVNEIACFVSFFSDERKLLLTVKRRPRDAV